VQFINVTIEGIADVNGYIDEFLDVEAEAVNTTWTPGDQFILTGHKLKIAGDDPACGLYITPVDPAIAPVKVTRIAENTPGKIVGVLPDSTGSLVNRLVIRTQYAGAGNIFLKTPRVITSQFTIEES